MRSPQAEKFSSFLLTSERELSDEITQKISINGTILINIYFLFQLNLFSGSFTSYHIRLSIAVLLSLFIAVTLVKRTNKNSPLLLNSAVLLLAPIYIDQQIQQPWISYGLLTAIAAITATFFQNRALFLATLLSVPLIQYAVATLGLKGVTDSKDLLLLNSYFSSIWLIVAGLGIYLVRITYNRYCEQIDEQLLELQDNLIEESKRRSELNLRDYQNISLHGTILNTLISYSQMNRPNINKQLSLDLSKDLKNIESSEVAKNNSVPFKKLLEDNLKYDGIQIKLIMDSQLLLPNQLVESALEIVREITLNIKKHTSSKSINIFVTNNLSFLEIKLEEVLPLKLANHEMDQKLIAANNSKTLVRLTNTTGVDIKLASNTNRDKLIYTVKLYTSEIPTNILSSIAKLRVAALSRNVELLTAVSVAYSYIAIIGFFIIQIPTYILITLLVSTVALTIELLKKNKSRWLPVISQLILLTVIPYSISTNESCQNLLYTPWLFNAVIGAVLYGIAVVKNPFLKWLPALIFIVENLLTKFTFPKECQNLLDGSTPGFVFILIFGFLMARLRKRNIALDDQLTQSLNSQVESSIAISTKIDLERSRIIEELRLFTRNLPSAAISGEQLAEKISYLIQKIRVFLICSEYFSSPLIQEIYRIAIARLNSGSAIKVSIYTSQLSEAHNLDFELLNELDLKSRSKGAEIVISENDFLTLEYLVEGETIASFKITN